MQDFIAIIAFVGAYIIARYTPYAESAMYIATAVLMLTSLLQLLWQYLIHKRIEKRHALTTLIIWALGGLTLIVHNDLFIKFKPTLVNLVIAIAFLASQFLGKENLCQKMLGSALEMPKALWDKLNIAWVIFFIIMGIANIFAALYLSNNAYVAFKFWGLMGASLLFIILQIFILKPYLKHHE